MPLMYVYFQIYNLMGADLQILDSAPFYTHTHKHPALGIQNKEV